MIIKSLHTVLLVFSISFLDAQITIDRHWNRDIIFDHYNAVQGFNSFQALCLEKTKDEFVWIGTEQGLVRYDGHVFKSFRSNPFDSTTISSNYIRNMVEDKHGRLWITALPDLNVFDTKTGKCKRIEIPKDIDVENKLDIRTLAYDERNDVMWLGTNKGLLYSQGKEVNLKVETIPEKNINSGIYDIEMDGNGGFWLAANDGLWQYDVQKCTVRNFHRPSYDPKVKYDDGFMSLYLNKKNNTLWIGSWVNGLMKFDILSKSMSNYTFADKTKVQNGILTINQSGFKGEENILWLGTSDGVKTFDISTHEFKGYKTSKHDDTQGVPGAGFCFEPTKTEGMWIGTFQGLHRYDPYKQNIKVLDLTLSNSQSDWKLGGINFEPGSQKDSIIWFGIGYESFFRYDIIQNREVDIPTVLKPYCQKVQPFTSYIDSKNILWLSSNNKGLVGYDLTKGKLIVPHLNIEKKEIPKILKIVEDQHGNLWMGSLSGMYMYNRARNEVIEEAHIRKFINGSKLSEYAFRFTVASDGKIWIFATQKYEEDDALYCFDSITKKIKLFTQKDYPALRILKSLEGIVSISKEKLVITSFNGFCVMDVNKDIPTFDLFDTYKDKPLGGYRDIITDHEKNLWISTDSGITRFNIKKNAITNFNYYNSNIGVVPTPAITFSNRSKTVYISQNLAINSISLDVLKMAKPGKVILSDMKIVNFTLDTIPNSGQTLDLKYDQNNIDLHFSNLSFTNSQSNTYQYKLEGIKTNWLNLSENHLKFDNLGCGTYVLKVRAENSFGLNSPNEFLLNIAIAPPFWRTWWFNGLIITLISFVIYSLFKYRELQREKLEKLRHNIARDLHDDMGSTLSHIKMMSERESMRQESNPSFQIIADKTSEVMSNMSEIIWSINPKNDSLKNIIGKIQEFAIDTLEPLGIQIAFTIDDDQSNVQLNPEERRHFYLIFKEAINNTAKYSQASQVHFTFKIGKREIITTFEDNGIGFDPLLIKRGNGLKNMANRAQILNGKFNILTGETKTLISLTLSKRS